MPYQLTLPNGKVVGDIPDNIPQDKALGIIRGKMPDAFSRREEAVRGTYELTLPNGKVVGDIPEGMPREQALEIIRARMPDAFAAPKEGMSAAFMGGLEGLGSRLRTGVEAIVSPEEAARRGLERGEAISREYAPGASLQRVKDVYAERGLLPAAGEAISQIPTAIAEQAPNIAATIASGKAGAMAGTAIAPGIGTLIGGGVGAVAPSLLQLFGSNIERQAEAQRERGEPTDISRGKALAAAVPGAALEAASTFIPLGRTMVGKLLGPQGAKMLERGSAEATEALAKESLTKVLAKGSAVGLGVEVPTEVTQQMLERLQAGLPITSDDAFTEYGEAAYGASLVGGPFGAAGRVAQRSAARQEIAPKPEEAVAVPPAPAATYFDQASPLENPYGNITADLMPDVTKEINAARSKRKQGALDSFSIEDVVNAGLPQERVDSILANSLQRAGIAPDLQIAPEDIYDTARIAGVDTEQPGFRDFLRRSTGSDNPDEMSPVQRVAALGAIQNLPEGVDSLPTGTNARSFTEAQYKTGLKAIKATPAGGVTRDEMLANIQKSGVKNIQDAMSILQTAIRDGNVGGVAAPAYAVADADGKIVGRYDDPQEAQDRAERLNGSVAEFAQTRYFPSEQAARPVTPQAPVLPEMQALQQKLAPELKRFGLEDVGLKIVQNLGQEGADGAYANRLIQVALGAENPMGVMRHESVHALKELGAFKPREWRALEKKAQSEWVDKFIRQPGLYDRYQQVYQEQTGSLAGFDEYIAEEAIAEAFKYFDKTKPPVGLIGNLFNRLRNFFASVRNAMQGAGFQTAEEVLGRIEEGKVTPTRAEATAAEPRYSIKSMSKAPDWVPQEIWDLHEKLQRADAEASGEITSRVRGKAPGALKRNQTMAFRRLNNAVTKFIENDDESGSKSLALMVRMNQESSRREKEAEDRGAEEPKFSLKRRETELTRGADIPIKNTKIISDVALIMELTPEEFASTSLIHQTGRAGAEQFDSEKIGGLPDVVKFLENERLMSGLPLLHIEKPEDRKILAKLMATEAMAAIRSGGSNLQWYDSIIDKTLAMAGIKYPELNTDINARVAFRIATAITSQGLNVEDNLAFAMRVYDQFRVNGKFPEIGLGKDQESMAQNFKLANYLLEDMKPNLMRQFLETEFTVEELRRAGFSITGELADEKVLGSSVFGPKIGFGFYSNLSGNFEPVTMDMWFMRTIGRLTGNLRSFRQDLYDSQLNKFRSELDTEGGNGIFANQFDQNEVELAKVNDEAAEALARKVKSAHERDYKVNRALFDNGAREKSKLVAASETMVNSLDNPKDAPSNGTERRNLRDVVRQMVSIVEEKYGKRVPPASLQAAIWYPEQELYKAMGVKLRVTSQNYAGAIEKILTGEGYGKSELESAAKLGSRTAQRLAKSTVSDAIKKTGGQPIRLGPLQAGEKESLLYRGRRRVVLEEERVSPKRKRVMLEVAPDPNNKALVKKWQALSNDQRIDISDKIANEIVKDALSQFGLKGYLDTQVGSYLDATNPSFALYLDSGDSVAVAKFLGYALSQDAMTVISPKAGKGLDKTGSVRLNIGDATASEVDDIYQKLREIKVDGKSPVNGQSYVNGHMVVLNYSNVPTDQLAKLINSKLSGDYEVITEDVYTAFPEKGDYNYASPSSDPRGNAGVLRQAARDFRAKATNLLGKELKQARKTSRFSLTPKREATEGPRYGRKVTADTIDVDGQERPTRTSKGTLIFPTEEGVRNFWRWFGDSAFVDDAGRPLVMYHGTAREIDEFIPRQANAIFITPNVSFAADFKKGVLGGVATWSEGWMVENYEDILTPEQIERAKLKALSEIDSETKKDYKLTPKSHHSAFVETSEFNQALLDEMPSRANVIPLFVKAENPFNYDNPNHVRQVVNRVFLDAGVDLETDPNGLIRFEDENGSIADKQYSEAEVYKMLSKGYWPLIEQNETQDAIRSLGFDGFSVQEALTKNYAVYDSAQLKSAVGNTGEFSPEKKGIRYSIAQTKTPEFKRWFGDSKVVDAEGKPLVVYHATESFDGNEFRLSPKVNRTGNPDGFYFTYDREDANRYSGNKSGSQIIPVYLSIKNPYRYGDSVHSPVMAKAFEEELRRDNPNLGDDWIKGKVDIFKEGRFPNITFPTDAMTRVIKSGGYDGMIDGRDWVAFDPTQIKSAIGNVGTFDPTKKDIRYSIAGGKAFDLDPTTSKDNFIYLFQDKNIDLKRVVDGVYKTGKKIADRWNAYEKEESYYGRSAERIKKFGQKELHNLTQKMDEASIPLQEMDDYLLARHAKEANAYLRTINPDPNQNSGMSDAEADAYMQSLPAGKKAILERLAKDVDAITKGTRDLMVEYGLENRKAIDQWEKTYKHYVPLFREESEGQPLSAGRGYSVRGSTSRRRTGSTRKVVDVLANIVLQREKVIARGEHNRVGNSLYGMVLLNPNPDFWSVIRPNKMTKDQLRAELFKLGIDPKKVDEMADRPIEKIIDKKTGMVTYRVPPLWKENDNLLFTRVNGEERVIAFNQNDERAMRLVTALKGMDAQKQAETIKAIGTAGQYFKNAIDFTGKTTRYFASINTQYNPAFGIYNLMRDTGGATINLQTTPLKGMERKVVSDGFIALRQIYKDIRRSRDGLPPTTKWGRIFEDFGLQGGKSGFSELFRDSQERSDALQKELNRFKEGKLKGKGRALLDWLSDFNEAIENAIRVSTYQNALDKGLSKQKAASLAKNITVNFNRSGAMSKHIQTLYAFFNAAVQGSARIAQTLMTPDGKLSKFGKKFVVGSITLGMMQAVLLAMAGIDEDELPDHIKDKSIVLPYGDGKYFSIPLPLGYHVFPAFGRRVMEFAMSDDKNVGKAVISTAMMIADGFNPFGSATFLQTITPTALDPLVALAENRDFNSKPIAIEDVSSMSPTPGYTRASQNALAVTKGLAYAINILTGGTEFKPGAVSPTPDQIEYLVGQLTGGVGREAMKIGRGAQSIVTGDELATYNIPIVGRLIGNTQEKAAQVKRFYDNVKTMNEHQAEIEGRLNSNQDVTEYLKKYPEAAMYQEADKIYRKISQLRSEKEYMRESGESREAIKRIDDTILEMMAGFNEVQSRYRKEIKATQK